MTKLKSKKGKFVKEVLVWSNGKGISAFKQQEFLDRKGNIKHRTRKNGYKKMIAVLYEVDEGDDGFEYR